MADSARHAPPAWRKRLYLPAYRTIEAARLAEIHPQTVARWHYGYLTRAGNRTRPIFAREKIRRLPLSYLQLVEVSFVAVFRQLDFTVREIRAAHDYLSKVFNAEYPFAELELKTDGARILKEFEESEGLKRSLVVANQAGQMMWPEMVTNHIFQFEYDYELALRWYPRGRDIPIVIDPRVSFGAPIIEGTGVPTWVVKERREAGEDIREIADDFSLNIEEVRAALKFERVDELLVA